MDLVDIQPVQLGDGIELIEANRRNREYHWPWTAPFIDREGFQAWFDRAQTPSQISLVARQRETRIIVGVFNLTEICFGPFENAYLGFYGMSELSGRGLMTEALRKTVAFAFEEAGLHRVEANIQPDNLKSISLVQRVGFRKEGYSPRYLKIGGLWRDHERWALLSDEGIYRA